MPAKVFSAATLGIEALPVEVEVDVSQGIHAFRIVGLPDKAVEESKERVSSALKNSGAKPPVHHNKRITVNLAPADFKKEGASYDLAIAIGFLIASGQVFPFDASKKIFLGELALEGKIRRVSGALPIVEMAIKKGFQEVFLPKENLPEVSFLENIKLLPVENLTDLILHLEGKNEIRLEEKPDLSFQAASSASLDMAEISGQESAKRVLEIAAAGGHNVLFQGPPGTGKTLLARTFPTILPRLALEEAIEVTKIYSVSGLLNEEQPLITSRPFRAPHHTASGIAIIGGGSHPRPGEVSLAHRGVLFLDEFPEFPRHVIENLRQPMEDGSVTVARARGSIMFPAKFILIAAMNPCPCGWYGDPKHECQCSLNAINNYRRKISGPIRDRIDLTVQVPRINFEELSRPKNAEPSEKIRSRVEASREIQKERFREINKGRRQPIFANAEMGVKEIKEFCEIEKSLRPILTLAEEKYGLSPRAIHRILKTSRTIADLAGEEKIREPHLTEALQYREMAE